MTRPPPLDPPPPYPPRHTAADPSAVVTETQVPNEQKALPSQKGSALVLAFGGAAVALAAVILDYYEQDTAAIILAIVAVLMTVVAVVMALNDARTGAGAPILCAIVASVVLIVALMDVLDVPQEIEQRTNQLEDNTRQRIEENRGEIDQAAEPATNEAGG